MFGIQVVHMPIYTELQAVRNHGVCSAVYDTVHYKEPFKSFDKSRVQSRLRASFCRDIAMVVQNVKQYSPTETS